MWANVVEPAVVFRPAQIGFIQNGITSALAAAGVWGDEQKDRTSLECKF